MSKKIPALFVANYIVSGLTILLMGVPLTAIAQQNPVPIQAVQTGPQVTQWPLRVDSPDGLLTVYEPQPEKFEGDTLTARAAVSLTAPAAPDPEFGAMWFTARVVTDRDTRIVTIQDITVRQVKLPNSSPDQEKQFGQVLQQQIPPLNVSLSLDQLEATLGVVQKAKEESQQLDNQPPKIIFTTAPATLVLLDGPPKLQQSAAPGVMTVVNTPFIMLLDLQSKHYFLKAGETWMTAPDATGPWSQASNAVPAGVTDAAAKLVSQSPPTAATPAAPATGPTQIVVAEEPTELISSTGDPTYSPLPGNDLLYMSNTESDVFMEVASQQYFVLLSGRWYQGKSLQGPWAFVGSDKLPAAFAQIPADSSKAHVLVSVAGTQPAKDARLDAYIPQTTAIHRDSGASLTVSYDGEPQFVPVDNTPITYASNCVDPVLFVDNSYFCCHQAVWYRGGFARGPWVVCDSVPQVIYTLPPSCPVYNCRYCYIYDSTPDVVYCGYLPGYTGCYVYGPTIVYGTGYRYSSWYQNQFIPRPYTWGFSPRYDYYAGSWGYGASFTYGSTWFAASPFRHNWFGPQGYIDYREVHAFTARGRGGEIRNDTIVNNRTEVRNVTINRINIYNRQENVKRNVAVSINRAEVINNSHSSTIRDNSPKPIRAYPAAENNVYAGHDGQVYRRTDQGWESHDAKGWQPAKSVPESGAEFTHQENVPQHTEDHPAVRDVPHEVQVREAPDRVVPRDIPARETPSRDVPARETPAREAPARVEAPNNGLEAEHIARQRGAESPAVNNGGGERGQAGNGGGGRGNGNPGGGTSGGNTAGGKGGR